MTARFHIPKFNILLMAAFVGIVAVTGLSVLLKSYTSPTGSLYVKMKVSQGLWWSNSEKPPLWLAQSIGKDDAESDLFGNATAVVIDKRYYPADVRQSPNQYDVFLTLKLAVKLDKKSGDYRYKRALVTVGTPISLDLSSAQVTGTVLAVSRNPFESKLQKKTLTMYDHYGYFADAPIQFENIKVGDTYFDGTDYPVKIVGKRLIPRQITLPDGIGRAVDSKIASNQTVVLEVEIMVEEKEGKLIYGGEQQVVAGASLNLTTNTLDLSQFVIAAIK